MPLWFEHWVDAATACPVIAHQFLVDIYQNVPLYLTGHHYTAVLG